MYKYYVDKCSCHVYIQLNIIQTPVSSMHRYKNVKKKKNLLILQLHRTMFLSQFVRLRRHLSFLFLLIQVIGGRFTELRGCFGMLLIVIPSA